MGTPPVTTALVFAGGDALHPGVRDRLPHADLVVAADSGLDHAYSLGVEVDVLVGDLDSVGANALERARVSGITIEVHPADKDHTDLELAMAAAIERGAGRVVLVGGAGGRLDHLLANVAVLASDRYAAVAVEAVMGDAALFVVRTSLTLHGSAGGLVSLLAVGGDAQVSSTGLRYPLGADLLEAGVGRGVSNELVADRAEIVVTRGVVLVVQPEAHAV